MSRHSHGILSRIAAVALGILLAGLLLGLCEASLRLFGVAAGSPRHDPFAGFGSNLPLFERADASTYRMTPARLMGRASEVEPEDGREFRIERPSGSFRAFVVGGSSAAGVPYPPRYAFSGWLQRLLEQSLPGLHVEVVNAAISGYASRRLLPIVREIAGYEPDLLIVYMGHNEWAERRYYEHLIEMDPRLFRLWQWSVDTRLYRVLAPLFRFRFRPSGDPEVIEQGAQANSLEMFAVLQDRAGGEAYPTPRDLAYRDLLYEFNLASMADVARAAGAQTLFLTLSQNYSDWPPGASEHRADLTEAELRRFEGLYARSRDRQRRGDCREALDGFRKALAIDDRFAALHFELAECLQALGEMEAARAHFRRASDLDRVPHGAPTYFNDIIRSVARSHDSPVVDVDALLAEESGDALVGDDLFVDWVHPNLRAHLAIATAVAAELRRAGLPVAARHWGDPAPLPAPAAVHAADPSLHLREREMHMFACLLALRDACVRTVAESLLRLDPDNARARAALVNLNGRRAAGSARNGSALD